MASLLSQYSEAKRKLRTLKSPSPEEPVLEYESALDLTACDENQLPSHPHHDQAVSGLKKMFFSPHAQSSTFVAGSSHQSSLHAVSPSPSKAPLTIGLPSSPPPSSRRGELSARSPTPSFSRGPTSPPPSASSCNAPYSLPPRPSPPPVSQSATVSSLLDSLSIEVSTAGLRKGRETSLNGLISDVRSCDRATLAQHARQLKDWSAFGEAALLAERSWQARERELLALVKRAGVEMEKGKRETDEQIAEFQAANEDLRFQISEALETTQRQASLAQERREKEHRAFESRLKSELEALQKRLLKDAGKKAARCVEAVEAEYRGKLAASKAAAEQQGSKLRETEDALKRAEKEVEDVATDMSRVLDSQRMKDKGHDAQLHDLREKLRQAEREASILKGENICLRRDKEELGAASEREVENQRAKRRAELEGVEARVKEVLEKKEAMLRKAMERADAAERKARDLENMIATLDQEITPN